MEITLSISKKDVMKEVAVTTAYAGAKRIETDENAPERIATVDEDEAHLERFWDESRGALCQELTEFVSYEGMAKANSSRYELELEVSNAFNKALLPSMNVSLMSYFVHSIVAKWYVYTNKEEAGAYADKAAVLLDDIHRMAMHKMRPERPSYFDN